MVLFIICLTNLWIVSLKKHTKNIKNKNKGNIDNDYREGCTISHTNTFISQLQYFLTSLSAKDTFRDN